jgi:squalene-hopene/tetraprenyl-beta-curcumene cyclase
VTTSAATDLRGLAGPTLQRAVDHLLALQDDEGRWWGELESNATITAEHLFLLKLLGVATPADDAGVEAELRASQMPEGGWGLWHGAPADLSTTVEAWYALRLAGVPAEDPAMKRAEAVVRALGGANRSRFFTKLWLAVLGRYPYEGLPALPPEVIYLPPRAPFSVYRFACWARGTFVPLMVVLSRNPVFEMPVGLDELFLEPPGTGPRPAARTPGAFTPWFERADPILRAYGRRPLKRLRRAAEKRIARWIVERQEADGSWGGIQPPWVYSLIALRTLGYPLDHPVMKKGLEGLDSFVVRDGDRLRMQGCISPVWDTALAVIGLADAGLAPSHPALARARDWLLRNEIDHYGDWHIMTRRGRPGGWAFELANDWYPDTDDTAEVLMALVKAGVPRDHAAVRRGVEWLLAMQSANGGWGSFDVDNDRRWMTQLPVCDFGEVIDPPTEDVTAHVIEALAQCGLRGDHPAMRRGVEYLKAEQRDDGSWWGRWGVNHVYGTGAVLPALANAGEDMGAPYIRRAVRWLAEHQNQDGGWGEDIRSYADPEWIGRGQSTASQTAWALLALHAAEPSHPAVADGLRFLADTQLEDGSWTEEPFTGTGFPGDFMIRYHLYRMVFPVTALARFAT